MNCYKDFIDIMNLSKESNVSSVDSMDNNNELISTFLVERVYKISITILGFKSATF